MRAPRSSRDRHSAPVEARQHATAGKHKARGSPIDRPMAGQGYLQDDRPDFPKILEFFTDPRTEDLQARQHALLKRIVQKMCKRF